MISIPLLGLLLQGGKQFVETLRAQPWPPP
jgi:hypothetical protein